METKEIEYNGETIEEKKEYKYKNIKYPFNGISQNLINKFLVLGYEKKIIEYAYLYDKNPEYKNGTYNFLRACNLKYRPSPINEINIDFSQDLLDNDLISEIIFPDFPKIFYLDGSNFDKMKEVNMHYLAKTYSIIFSINQEVSGTEKRYNGLGYVFFTSIEYKKNDKITRYFYVPMVYVIISEYPYFHHFNKICKSIYRQMKKEDEDIPLEILLYNTIKFLPSPINKSIILLFEGIPRNNKSINMNQIYNPSFSDESKKNENKIPSIYFNQLSGYPIIDFNLSFIFNLISVDIIVQVFIFTFLEYDIIFYSSQPRIANLVMFIFSNLNYPFNNSKYFRNILSVSMDNLIKGKTSFKEIQSPFMIGVIISKSQEIPKNDKIKDHFVLDLNHKKFFYSYSNKTDEVKNTLDLLSYVKTFTENEFENSKLNAYGLKHGINLSDNIIILVDQLKRRSNKVTNKNYNQEKAKLDFFNIYEDESEIECIKKNNLLQRSFLNFILQIINNFVEILNNKDEEKEIDNEDMKSQKGHRDSKVKRKSTIENQGSLAIIDKNLAILAGKIFKEKFMKTSKYNSFIVKFCKYQEVNDLYRIPYFFTYEFIRYSKVDFSQINLLKIIDQFYGKKKRINLEKLYKDNNSDDELSNNSDENDKNKIKNAYLFNFNNFTKYYEDNLKEKINREKEDDKEIFSKLKNNSKYKKYSRKGYFLSNKIIKFYINYINNNFNEIGKLFGLIKFELDDKKNINLISAIAEEVFDSAPVVSKNNLSNCLLDDNNNINKNESDSKIFGSYNFFEIPDIIEKNLALNRYFSSYTLIKFSLLNILAITLAKADLSGNINIKKIIETIFDFCEQTNFLVRQYINIYLNIFHNLKNKFVNKIKDYEDSIAIIIKNLNKTDMIPKEESEIGDGETKNPDIDTPQASSETPSGDGNNKKLDKFFEENGKFFSMNDGIFNKNKKNKYEETLKIIEVVFSGNYDSNDIYISDSINKLYDKLKFKNKNKPKKFIPKTPLNLYSNSNKLLNNYLEKYSLVYEVYDDLLLNLLSLLYYFKIPIIGGKWKEKYIEKEANSEKNSINDNDELIKILKIIITILSKLFEKINIEKDRLSKIFSK